MKKKITPKNNQNIYSNAFNFSSYLSGQVDLRTGQYGSVINLATLIPPSNPALKRDITLSFSALNPTNAGYGKGWSLNAYSTFHINDGGKYILRLYNGVTYEADALPDQGEIIFKDKKLKDSFITRVKEGSTDQIHIYYKNGIKEVLNKFDFYKTDHIVFPNGETFRYHYNKEGNKHPLQLLAITTARNLDIRLIDMKYHNDGNIEYIDKLVSHNRKARISFTIQNSKLSKVTLPYDTKKGYDERSVTSFTYREINGYTNIKRLQSAFHAIEEIDYKTHGHKVDHNVSIPYVIQWRFSSTISGESICKTYEYSLSTNFLGYDSAHAYQYGEDNLYREGTYSYWGKEKLLDAKKKVVQEKTATYNRFHLLIEECIKKGHAQTTKTIDYNYNEEPNKPFSEQPANLHLPKRITTEYKNLKNGASRSENISITTDDFGNTESRINPTGIKTEYTYYPIKGKGDNCPAEPFDKFVTYVEQKTISPVGGSPETPKVSTFTYKKLPKLTDTENEYFVLPHTTTTHQEKVTQAFTYYNTPENPQQHGKLQSVAKTQEGKTQTQNLSYTFSQDTTQTTATLNNTFDSTSSTQKNTTCHYTGLVLQTIDPENIQQAITYDGLGRITQIKNAVGTDYETTQSYAYKLHYPSKNKENGHPLAPVNEITFTDTNDIQSLIYYDGLGRISSQEKQYDKGGSFYEVSAISYDALGQKSEETIKDYKEGENDPIYTAIKNYTYDDWGQTAEIQHNSGQIETHSYDPVAMTRTQGLKKTGEASSSLGTTRTTYNLFQKPEKIEQLHPDGTVYSTETIQYDGFGRKKSYTTSIGQTASLEYDDFDRVIRFTDFDGTIQTTTYADWIPDSLIEQLTITSSQDASNTYTLGTQTFDGLGRVTSRTVGGRKTNYPSYTGPQQQPTQITTPKGSNIHMTYIPALGLQPQQVRTQEGTNHFSFATQSNATTDCPVTSLKTASNDHATYAYTYSPTGFNKEIVLTDKTQTPNKITTTQYTRTLSGLPLTTTINSSNDQSVKTDIDYTYDPYGRLISTSYNDLLSTTQYDDLGRIKEIKTDGNAFSNSVGHEQITQFTYDAFNRVTKKETTLKNTSNKSTVYHYVIELTYDQGNKLTQRIRRLDQDSVTENFSYDIKDRLQRYTATTSQPSLLPQDAYGMAIKEQQFAYNLLNNLLSITTKFQDNSQNVARYFYENSDKTQVSKMTHTHPSYPNTLTFQYDQDGNLLQDGTGNSMAYTTSGRLKSTNKQHASYTYDPYDRLFSVQANSKSIRHYLGDQVVVEQQDYESTGFIRHNGMPIAQIKTDGHNNDRYIAENKFLATDYNNSIVAVYNTSSGSDNQVKTQSYAPYGASKENNVRLGFNGELQDEATELYHLGNGTRVYHPGFGLFTSPDSWSPFHTAGINPYAYCHGDPLNLFDPTGHIPDWLKITLGVGGLVLTSIIFFAALAAIPVTGGLSFGVALGVTSGLLGILGSEAGLASTLIPMFTNDPGWLQASDILGKVSLGLGVAAFGTGIGAGLAAGIQRFSSFANALALAKKYPFRPIFHKMFYKDLRPLSTILGRYAIKRGIIATVIRGPTRGIKIIGSTARLLNLVVGPTKITLGAIDMYKKYKKRNTPSDEVSAIAQDKYPLP